MPLRAPGFGEAHRSLSLCIQLSIVGIAVVHPSYRFHLSVEAKSKHPIDTRRLIATKQDLLKFHWRSHRSPPHSFRGQHDSLLHDHRARRRPSSSRSCCCEQQDSVFSYPRDFRTTSQSKHGSGDSSCQLRPTSPPPTGVPPFRCFHDGGRGVDGWNRP